MRLVPGKTPIRAARRRSLDVVAQLQFDGVGVEIPRPPEVGLVVLAHVMADQGDRHDEGDQAPVMQAD